MKLYFDFAKEVDVGILAVACYPDRGGLKPLFKKTVVERELDPRYNNYHCMLLALQMGLDELYKWLEKNDTDENVTISTQHKQVLDWLYTKKVGSSYIEIFNEISEQLEELSQVVDFDVLKVDKKINLASNLIKLQKQKIAEEPLKLSFGGNNNKIKKRLNKASGDNVVEFGKFKL